MKTLRQLALVLGALCGAAGLFAQGSKKASAPNPNDHDDLTFDPTPIVREFTDHDTGKKVTVTWKWTNEEGVGASRCDLYTCIIHQDAPPVNGLGYSLYNLEVQGRRWEVEVISATGNPQFISCPAASITSGTNPDGSVKQIIPAVCGGNWPPPMTPDVPVPARISFIKFTGTDCTLQLRSKRLRHGPTMGVKFSHDTTPPPGAGGSEN